MSPTMTWASVCSTKPQQRQQESYNANNIRRVCEVKFLFSPIFVHVLMYRCEEI